MIKGLLCLLVVAAILLAALAIETWRDGRHGRRGPAASSCAMRLAPLLLALTSLLTLLIAYALAPQPARGRDLDGRYAGSALKPWFDHLASGKGLCCSMADGETVEDPDWLAPGQGGNRSSRYQVRLEGAWLEVPDDAVITEPNRAGRTMVWPMREYADGAKGKLIGIRCFMPGTMG